MSLADFTIFSGGDPSSVFLFSVTFGPEVIIRKIFPPGNIFQVHLKRTTETGTTRGRLASDINTPTDRVNGGFTFMQTASNPIPSTVSCYGYFWNGQTTTVHNLRLQKFSNGLEVPGAVTQLFDFDLGNRPSGNLRVTWTADAVALSGVLIEMEYASHFTSNYSCIARFIDVFEPILTTCGEGITVYDDGFGGTVQFRFASTIFDTHTDQ